MEIDVFGKTRKYEQLQAISKIYGIISELRMIVKQIVTICYALLCLGTARMVVHGR